MNTGRRERGVALITILVVVVIASVLGVAMAREQHLVITQTRNHFDQSQAAQYALGGEELARQILWADHQLGDSKDTLADDWANPELNYEFEDGEVAIRINDLQGRLNINALAGDTENAPLVLSWFQNLFNQQGIDPAYVARIKDWIDADNSTTPLGAEDYDYLGLERPYRTPGHQMVSLSEMRLLIEMDPDTFARIEPFVAAIPDNAAPLNVNSASPIVLGALRPDTDFAQLEGLVAIRDEQGGYDTLENFLQEAAMIGVAPNGLGVQSAFFEVTVRARYQDRFSYLTSIIQRDPGAGSMVVVYRNSSKKILPVVTEADLPEADG